MIDRVNAAFYTCAAELYVRARNPEKDILYDRFVELFARAFASGKIERYAAPYEGVSLPVIRITPATERKGTIVLHEGIAPCVVDHLKYITRPEKALDALDIYLRMNDVNIHSELVRQDVLVLSGERDHFIPRKMHGMQIAALSNARSVTGRVFTEKEHAQNPCQIGKVGLAPDVMIDWIDAHSKGSDCNET